MSNLFDYSTTAASNNGSSPDGAAEGMLPSNVNNVLRQVMANAAGAFQCYTAGGTSSAMTVTMSPTLAAYSNKVRIAFIPPANNTAGGLTLNVNSLGAVAVKMLDGTDPPAGALNSSGVAVVQHNGTNYTLLNPAGIAGLGIASTAAEIDAICDGATSGTYTGTGTGFGTPPTVTVYYRVFGNIVFLETRVVLTGTSNGGTFTITGAPSGIRPVATSSGYTMCSVQDNGTGEIAMMIMSTAGTITLSRVPTASWTSSGTKLVQPFTMWYSLNLPS